MQHEAESSFVGCIITEETATNIEFKVQGENKNGFVIAEGTIQNGNETNRNRRYYPTDELRRALNAPRQKELVESGNFKGEAGHPLDKTLARQSKIDPTNEQVWYTKIWMEGDSVKARFRGTNNDLGKSFNDDLKDGQRPSFSLRALGSLVNENGRMTVRNMQIVTYDRVYFPSHPGAYTEKIITTESAGNQIIYIPKKFEAKRNEIEALMESGNSVESPNIVTPLTQQEVNNFILSESTNLRNVINQFDIFYESVELNPDMRTVTMKTRLGDTIHLSLETAVSREIINGISDMF
jgi:hypothetical protein